MRQAKLENKVRNLFIEQGFELKKVENHAYRALKDDLELKLHIFSSDKFSEEDIQNKEFFPEDKVFVDEELSEVKSLTDTNISVISESKSQEEYELPSYELIGEIAVINELQDYSEEKVVEGILSYNPNVKTILVKEDSLSGEFRVGNYTSIYGSETETIHKEFGCRFKVDPTKTYYSERFSTERKRVVDKIEDDENVLVMFAGVGPFAILAAEHSKASKVVAIEKNPSAYQYLSANIKLNKVEDTVEAYEGDVKEVIPKLETKFDRVIMPLPGMANNYLGLALDALSEGVIHYYRFLNEENWTILEDEIKNIADSKNVDYEILDKVVCGEKSPSVSRVCIDVGFT